MMTWHTEGSGVRSIMNSDHQALHPHSISAAIEKGHLNRYKNIYPYEHARCRLQQHPDTATDYINASHIQFLSHINREYIASQGPLEASFEDFWQLVLQENVGVVVMLTNLKEGGREKCGKYYECGTYGRIRVDSAENTNLKNKPSTASLNTSSPSQSAGFFSAFDVQAASMTEPTTDSITRRALYVSRTDGQLPPRQRLIKHIKFAGWPDFDIPPRAETVIGLINEANKANEEMAALNKTPPGPILVHCSAGVGRTGCFMTIDVILHMLQNEQRFTATSSTPANSLDMETDPPVTSSATFATYRKSPQNYSEASPLERPDYIRELVDGMRGQRMSMVANYAQYRFCHEAILKAIAAYDD